MDDDLHGFETSEEASQYLRHAGSLKDEDLDLGETALALALLFLPGLRVDRFRQHLRKLCEQTGEEFQSRLRMREPDTLATRVQVLRKILYEAHGYTGDEKSYDDIQNVNLIRVIERRKGLPISLGILSIVLAEAQGWKIDGLNFPGHFLVRMEEGSERIILDPFKSLREMNAAELRLLLKSIIGKEAELSHNYYDAVSRRAILIRLENNLKKRLIEAEEYGMALVVVGAIETFAPKEYRTLFDKGILYAKLGQKSQSIEALENYIARAPDPKDRQHAQILLQQIKATSQ